jgi:hypothetical protein
MIVYRRGAPTCGRERVRRHAQQRSQTFRWPISPPLTISSSFLLNTIYTGGRTWLAVTNGREEGNARAERPPKPEAGDGPPESMKQDAIAGTAAAAVRPRSSVLEQQSFNIRRFFKGGYRSRFPVNWVSCLCACVYLMCDPNLTFF